jgi:hypothetical protein
MRTYVYLRYLELNWIIRAPDWTPPIGRQWRKALMSKRVPVAALHSHLGAHASMADNHENW